MWKTCFFFPVSSHQQTQRSTNNSGQKSFNFLEHCRIYQAFVTHPCLWNWNVPERRKASEEETMIYKPVEICPKAQTLEAPNQELKPWHGTSLPSRAPPVAQELSLTCFFWMSGRMHWKHKEEEKQSLGLSPLCLACAIHTRGCQTAWHPCLQLGLRPAVARAGMTRPHALCHAVPREWHGHLWHPTDATPGTRASLLFLAPWKSA